MASIRKDVKGTIVGAIGIVSLLVLWELVVRAGLVPNFLLPSPTQIALALFDDAPLIARHALWTILESVAGLFIGVVVGFVLAVLIDRFEVVSMLMNPLITLSQTVPTVAIAPLLVLWFGYGLAPKVILVVVTTFFPVAVSLVSGFSSVDPDLIDLMRTMRATPTQIFWKVKLPAAAEQFFSGLRISATYAIVGAVVAEWLGGFMGLGVYMTRVRKSFSYDRMFASIIVISACSILLMRVVDLVEWGAMPWKRASEGGQKKDFAETTGEGRGLR